MKFTVLRLILAAIFAVSGVTACSKKPEGAASGQADDVLKGDKKKKLKKDGSKKVKKDKKDKKDKKSADPIAPATPAPPAP